MNILCLYLGNFISLNLGEKIFFVKKNRVYRGKVLWDFWDWWYPLRIIEVSEKKKIVVF